MKRKPSIALTMGDPAGIGPELAVKAATDNGLSKICDIIVYGSPDIVAYAEEQFAGKGVQTRVCECGVMKIGDVPRGKNDGACGMEALQAVKRAVHDALDGDVDAVVTCPVNKASVNLAGMDFTGHTEFIAQICAERRGPAPFAMMQSSGQLRIAFATTHIPLSDVPRAISAERIAQVGRLLCEAAMQEGISSPRLAAAGLNPHAGENGFMGDEEKKIIIPALLMLGKEGIEVEGPFPPDTLFTETIRARYDGIISMYHDQGHIPFKMLAFDTGVNSTLGLPVIRTSVDHGTAFDIAWRGKADTGSLYAAVRLAARRASNIEPE